MRADANTGSRSTVCFDSELPSWPDTLPGRARLAARVHNQRSYPLTLFFRQPANPSKPGGIDAAASGIFRGPTEDRRPSGRKRNIARGPAEDSGGGPGAFRNLASVHSRFGLRIGP